MSLIPEQALLLVHQVQQVDTLPSSETNRLISLFNSGNFIELEKYTQLLLERYSHCGFVWKARGLALSALGQKALPALQKAALLMPQDAEAQNNLGNGLKDVGQLEQAAASYRLALEINPDYALAHSNLGNILRELNQLDLSVASCRRALQLQPNLVEAHNNLGNALYQLEQFEQAAASYRNALEKQPNFAQAHNNLGNALHKLGKSEEAVTCYHSALALYPDYAEAHNNLGTVLQKLKQFEKAEASCRMALKISPTFAGAFCNLGSVLHNQGKLLEAVESYRQSLQIESNSVHAHNDLGTVLYDLGRYTGAIASYQIALQLNSDFVEALNNLGAAFYELGLLDEAEVNYRRVLELKPDLAEAYNNLGSTLRDQGQIEQAQSCYQRALTIQPDFSTAYSNLVYLHAFTRNIPPVAEAEFAAKWELVFLTPTERTAASQRLFSIPARYGRKLRLGIVSAELGQHAVSEFLMPLLEHIDPERFHITLYPTTTRYEARVKQIFDLADKVQSLVGISDRDAAELIRSEQIDILLDTTGHMRNCRLGIFAHRASPVQCHYIGYHGTIGLTEMDWFIADDTLLPPAYDAHFREAIWRLPRLWVAYRGDVSLPESHWTPSPDGTVWLGSFNNLTKVRSESLALWAKVMKAIPQAKLLLKDRKTANISTQQRIKHELFCHGIKPDRVEFIAWSPGWSSHMTLYDKLDIALDTVPLNSGTTAFDALWMGVPLVALEGNWMGGRMSASVLRAFGKPDWVAQNEDDYAAIVSTLATDIEGRKLLRASQRKLMANSPLCDSKELTRVLEDNFEKMFDISCARCKIT